MQSTDTIGVAVLDQFEPALYACLADALPPGWKCTHARSYTESDQLDAVPEADVLFAGWALVTSQILAAAPRLRFIQKLGVGVDRVDLEACRACGIGVARLAGVNAVPVAEHAVMLILAAFTELFELDNVVLTPHSAGATADNFAFVARRAVANARAYLAGEPLPADDLVLAPGKD